jgi:hypothetical protein
MNGLPWRSSLVVMLIEDPRHELNDPSWEIARVVFWWLRQTSRVLFLDLSFGGEIQYAQ